MRRSRVRRIHDALRRLAIAGAFIQPALSGCGTDVVVAQVNVGQKCSSANHCLPGEYCYMTTCTATEGTCLLPPTACADTGESPVCDCNGVFYWDDCIRAMHQVAATRPCMDALPKTCAEESDCPDGSVCGNFNATCDTTMTPPGTCWGLPSTCPSDTGLFATCDGTRKCMNLCAAIETQTSFQALPFDPSCQ
jgi:hypothetical protein